MEDSNILITGANGQLGRALQLVYPNAKKTDSTELDITSNEDLKKFDWNDIKVIINAAAYTNVDGAETPEGEKLAWAVNDKAVGHLATIAKENNLALVHISTDYVFDGTKKVYTEDDPVKPLGVYGKSKAAGDKKAINIPKHYVVRSQWIIGDGKNFVRTMLELGKKGVAPTVVADQIGRPTFAAELARAISFLIEKRSPFGVYNVTSEGEPVSWANFARAIFAEAGFDLKVTDTTTTEYFASKTGVAPRPLNVVLDLTKIEFAGFRPHDWHEDLKKYVKKELSK